MKKRTHRKPKPAAPAIPRLRKGTIGTMGEYLKNVGEYSRFVHNNARKGQLTEEQRMKEILTLNSMLSTLYDMQEKIEKKIVKKEGDNPDQDEPEVEIKKGEVTVTVPPEPEMHEDKESLVHSEEFGKLLDGASVPLVEKKPEPVPEPEVNTTIKEIFKL